MRSPLLLVPLLLVTTGLGAPREVTAQDEFPPVLVATRPPIEPGFYEMTVFEDEVPLEVLEVTDGPFVKIRIADAGEDLVIWFNTAFALAFREISPEVMAEWARERREEAYTFAMRSELRNVQFFQEDHYAASERYAVELEELEYEPDDEIRVELGSADPATGYWAVATHEDAPIVCAVFEGEEANRRAPALEPGIIRCSSPDAGR